MASSASPVTSHPLATSWRAADVQEDLDARASGLHRICQAPEGPHGEGL